MINLNTYITEKLHLRKDKIKRYFPKDINELKSLVDKLIRERGNDAYLNDIDTSNITDMSFMFYQSEFNGDISGWDVSNVTNMHHMFYESKFNGDISDWNVSNVKTMWNMFYKSKFAGDISRWDVSNVTNMEGMFFGCKEFNCDLSNWDVSNIVNANKMFNDCVEFDGYKLEKWYNVNKKLKYDKYANLMFKNAKNTPSWYKK